MGRSLEGETQKYFKRDIVTIKVRNQRRREYVSDERGSHASHTHTHTHYLMM